MADFVTRLRERVAAAGNALCVGIDPPVAATGGFFADELRRLGPAAFLGRFAATLIEAAAGVAPAVKPQSAFFEAFGPEGFEELRRALRLAKDKGLVTVLDAKRGDISSTMAAYGRMAFDAMDADVLTVTPYMGFDVVEPLVPWLLQGRGVYIVWISSNASGRSVQEQRVAPDGRWLAEALLDDLVPRFEARGVAGAFGLVLGATKLDALPAGLRARVEPLPLLMPGVGAQGATVTPELRRVIAASGATLVPQSRALSDTPAGRPQPRTWDEYGSGVRDRVREAAAELAL